MKYLFDTSVVVSLRDRDHVYVERYMATQGQFLLSIVGRVELENGVYRDEDLVTRRRDALDRLLDDFTTLPFGNAELAAYRRHVSLAGYARTRVIDRMIAATAIANDATLVTANAKDVRDIEGLRGEDWSFA